MPTRAGRLELPLTPREIECIISWKEDVFWPDEVRLISKLRRALESAEPLTVSRVQLRIIWLGRRGDGRPLGTSCIDD